MAKTKNVTKKKLLYEKECKICGKKFTTKKTWAKFCSTKCRTENARYVKCPKCNHTFKRVK